MPYAARLAWASRAGTDRRMRILHVVRGLANSSGTTHIVGPLAEAQARLGHKVDVLFVDKPHAPAVVPDPALVRSHAFPMSVPTEHLGWSRPFAKAIGGAVSNADVVHVHAIWNYPTFCAMRAAHRARVPYVVAPQGSLESWALGRSRYLKAIYAAVAEKPYFDRAASMQALTEVEAAQCRAFGIRAPIRILPNGVDLEALDREVPPVSLRHELSLPAGSTLLLFLGRLFPKKGLDLLIPAFARLASTEPSVHLVIAGDDGATGYGDTVARMIADSGVSHRLHMLGEVQASRKVGVLRNADAFALPSYSEGLPVAVLEAMACGRPVVVTPHCNLPEIEAAEAGWVAEASVEAVLHGLRQAVASADERRRRGANGRRLVERRFTWTRIADDSVTLYTEGMSPTTH